MKIQLKLNLEIDETKIYYFNDWKIVVSKLRKKKVIERYQAPKQSKLNYYQSRENYQYFYTTILNAKSKHDGQQVVGELSDCLDEQIAIEITKEYILRLKD